MKGTVLAGYLLLSLFFSAESQDEVYKDPSASVDDRVDDLMSRMTFLEKVQQMIMDVENTEQDAAPRGAALIGASDPPYSYENSVEDTNTVENWRKRNNELHQLWDNNRLGIPILIATDCVHGQNILKGATIFPHNIGLGATRNPTLVRQIAQITAKEMLSTALDMTFAPTIAVAKTMTWGRTYEAYSEDTATVRQFVAPFIRGLQGTSVPWNVIGTAKHWVGDGATDGGEDAGDVSTLTEQELLDIHGSPYIDAIAADVGSVMISFSSFNGVQLHQHQNLLTNVLKGDMGFDGFVLTDWQGYTRNDGDYDNQIALSINAGADMLMAPYQTFQIWDSVTNSTNAGLISMDRIDDAVRRILRVKFKAGLFEKKVDPIDVDTYDSVGTAEHRAVARQAVRESLVLLKNENQVLPLATNSKIFLAGKSADDINNQCGGWTMSWQGDSTEVRHKIVGGTTIRDGLGIYGSGTVTFSEDGSGADPDEHDVAVVVVGETPYAEFEGDDDNLSLDQVDISVINTVKNSGVPMVLIIVSGRPMVITNQIDGIDAVVAAWLPGTEGDGVAQVLFGDYDFTGTLSFSWPRNMAQITNGFVGDNPNVLFPLGFGLTYQSEASTVPPTASPSTALPTLAPTDAALPTQAPSVTATDAPTGATTTDAPTSAPTAAPSEEDTTPAPSESEGTPSPTEAPSSSGTDSPTESPTEAPTRTPDDESPTVPGTPVLTGLTSTTVSFSWEASTDNIEVARYEIYDGSMLIGRTAKTEFTATDLTPYTEYSFTVVALDTSGNESPASDPLTVVTLVLVDNFEDGDDDAADGFGSWRTGCDGTVSPGGSALQTNMPGYEGYAARLDYEVGSGEWGFCNLFLDFADGNPVDFVRSNLTGMQFEMRALEGTTLSLQLGTPLAEYNWKYYEYELTPTEEWTTVSIKFDQFVGAEGIPYALEEALGGVTTLVWEDSTVGHIGWFMIDNVDFMTVANEPPPPEEAKCQNPAGCDNSGGASLSWTASILVCGLSFVFF